MIRKSFTLLALALVAAAVAAPIAQSATDPNGNTVADPLAVSYLLGQGMSPGEIKAATEGVDPLAASYLRGQGLSPSQIAAQTSGVCSGADRPTSCFQGNAFGSVDAKVDPLAVSYLIGKGYTPSEVEAWTVGACSHEVKPAACFGPSKGANLTGGEAKVDPLAVSYLTGQGLSPSEVTSWTTGACSHQTRAASCYTMFQPTATSTQVGRSIGFQWGDAGIGAGFTLGLLLLLGGAGAGLLISRRNRRRQVAHA